MWSQNDDANAVKPVRGAMGTLNFIQHLKDMLGIPSPAIWPRCILSYQLSLVIHLKTFALHRTPTTLHGHGIWVI